MQNVYVIGHRQPDTDSIASAVAYAELMNQITEGRYVGARCGDLNSETFHVLQELGLKPPKLVESVEPAVSDIPFFYQQSAPHDMPAIDVAAMMDEHEVRNIPIVDDSGKLTGLVSEHGLARAYVNPNASEQLNIGPISLETLARILHAEIVHKAHEKLEGRVSILIDALHVSLSRLDNRGVAVVGDNEPSQLALVSAGIGALIIAEAAPAGERVREAAKEKGVSLIKTKLDAFSVGRMLHLSHPAEQVMATDVQTVTPDDLVSTATRIVTNSPYRTACVVDREGKLLGMISRNTFLEDIHKSVILVDHNEFAQAAEGIETAEILEIIDHHRLGAITTLKPVQFLNEPLGSTSTIITNKYQEAGITPSQKIAGLLLAGILSDTLVLKMSTTTKKDRDAVAYLSEISDRDADEFGTTMIQKGMELEGVPLDDLLTQDTKPYSLFDTDLIIGQVMTASDQYHKTHDREIKEKIDELKANTGVNLYIVLFTDVINQLSYLYASGESGLIDDLGYTDMPIRLEGVMSRKKDFIPVLGQKLRNLR